VLEELRAKTLLIICPRTTTACTHPTTPLRAGVAVTDVCISVAQMVPVLVELAGTVRERRTEKMLNGPYRGGHFFVGNRWRRRLQTCKSDGASIGATVFWVAFVFV